MHVGSSVFLIQSASLIHLVCRFASLATTSALPSQSITRFSSTEWSVMADSEYGICCRPVTKGVQVTGRRGKDTEEREGKGKEGGGTGPPPIKSWLRACVVTSIKVMFSSASVCLCVSRITQSLLKPILTKVAEETWHIGHGRNREILMVIGITLGLQLRLRLRFPIVRVGPIRLRDAGMFYRAFV